MFLYSRTSGGTRYAVFTKCLNDTATTVLPFCNREIAPKCNPSRENIHWLQCSTSAKIWSPLWIGWHTVEPMNRFSRCPWTGQELAGHEAHAFPGGMKRLCVMLWKLRLPRVKLANWEWAAKSPRNTLLAYYSFVHVTLTASGGILGWS